MPEIVFQDDRCTIQLEGANLRIFIAPYIMPTWVASLGMVLFGIGVSVAFAAFAHSDLIFPILITIVLGSMVLMTMLSRSGWELIEIRDGWLITEYGLGSLSLLRNTHHLEAIRNLTITKETLYWSSKNCPPWTRKPSTLNAWTSGALAFSPPGLVGTLWPVRFGNQLSAETALTVMSYLLPYYNQYHSEKLELAPLDLEYRNWRDSRFFVALSRLHSALFRLLVRLGMISPSSLDRPR